MRHEELVHEEERDGFSVRLYFGEELDSPDWDMTDDEKQELFRKIDSGALLWFCAHVTVSRTPGGEVLGEDYLGGCCYESVAAFLAAGGYYEDMIGEAIGRAQNCMRQIARNWRELGEE